MPQRVNCDKLAAAKILLHAAKHPASAINGILLGSFVQDGDDSTISVVDVVPLFHTSNNLAAPVELALAQVMAYVGQPDVKVDVVGYYHSDARYQAADMTPVTRKVADKIASKRPAAVVVLLDNKKLSAFIAGEDTNPFELFFRDSSRGWKREAPTLLSLADSSWRGFCMDFTTMFKQRLHSLLWDFDDHLDDISKDWLNPQLASLGKMALPGQTK
ncbi:chlorophyll antenna size regulatory protein [Haematococcus lacustris]